VCRSGALSPTSTNPEADVVDSNLCAGDPPSALTRACAPDPCPLYDWVATTEWSTCSVQCGTGTQSRSVRCANIAPASWLDIPFEAQDDEAPCVATGNPKLPTLRSCSVPSSVCFGADVDAVTKPNGMCTSAHTCICRAGWAGDFCTETPRIFNVLTNGASYGSTGMPLGDMLQISWQNDGNIPFVSLLLSRLDASDASANWAVPLYIARDVVNTGKYSWPLGSGLDETVLDATGDGFVVLVWFSAEVHARAELSFAIADPCAYKSCGKHGLCTSGGRCECVPGYSGDTCALGPCERALCSSSYGSCLNEDYIGSPNVTEETMGICRCGTDASGRHYDGFQCRSPPDCTPKCKNGADLVNIIVDLNGKTDESKGQCGVCACMHLWHGGDCGTCGLQCFHGGTVDTQCASCDCASAPGYFGSTCACKFYAMTMQLHMSSPTDWVDSNPAAVARFARTFATDLALAAGLVAGVNVQVNVVAVRRVVEQQGGDSSSSGDDANVLEADIQFGLECPQLSAQVVGSSLLGSASTSSAMGSADGRGRGAVLGQAQAREGAAFTNLMSPHTIKDERNTAFFPQQRAAKEVVALQRQQDHASDLQHVFSALSVASSFRSLVEGDSIGSSSSNSSVVPGTTGPNPDVVFVDGRPTLLSVYNIFALALEDLSSPVYRGVVTSSLAQARVTSVEDLAGEDHPRVPGDPHDPFLSAAASNANGGGTESLSGLGVGGVVGLVIGLVVVLLLVALAVVLVRRRRRSGGDGSGGASRKTVSYRAPLDQGGDGGVGQERLGVQVVPSEPASLNASPVGSRPGSRPVTPPPAARRAALMQFLGRGGHEIDSAALPEGGGQFAPSPSGIEEEGVGNDEERKDDARYVISERSVSLQLNPVTEVDERFERSVGDLERERAHRQNPSFHANPVTEVDERFERSATRLEREKQNKRSVSFQLNPTLPVEKNL